MSNPSIKVERLALEGDGVGRIEGNSPIAGQVAFVPYTLPGETVSGQPEVQKKSHSRWIPDVISSPATSRVDPPCPYHFKVGQKGLWCGGCNWQHMAIDQQRRSKRQLIIESLERLGGIKNPPVTETIASKNDWRYRNKVQVPFGTRAGKLVAGFFAPGSHEIIEFDDCLIQPEVSVKVVLAIKRLAVTLGWQPYEEDQHRGWLRHVLIRTNEGGQAYVVIVSTDRNLPQKDAFIRELKVACPEVIGIAQNIQRARTNVILGREWVKIWGADRLEEHMAGLVLSYSPASFFQVNTGAAELLYEKAIRQLNPDSSTIVMDLYCGVGAMTLLAAKKAKFVLGIEVAESSIRDAQANAKANQVRNAKFVQADVMRFLKRPMDVLRKSADEKLMVMIDPPRTGCAPEVLQELLRLRPEKIVYVSCHPATLARDVKILNYRVESVTPVDLFPQTSHIESITTLIQSHGG